VTPDITETIENEEQPAIFDPPVGESATVKLVELFDKPICERGLMNRPAGQGQVYRHGMFAVILSSIAQLPGELNEESGLASPWPA
jgi:hypothetical protein